MGVDVRVAVSSVGKFYPIGPKSLVASLASAFGANELVAASQRGFWALRNVSFSVGAGRSLGVIGRNGAGKSTLLRIVSGVAEPTEGNVERRARVACLLELGVAFHPLESGRENAETTLVIQNGLTRRQARKLVSAVQDFADLGPFFERPIRTYSDGMRLRLAFATMAVLDPQVLVTDEILAVGDQNFQERCHIWFDRFLSAGGSLIICSHDLGQIQRLCDRAIWLENGFIRQFGDSREVVRRYLEAMGDDGDDSWGLEGEAGYVHGNGQLSGLPFEVVGLKLERADGGDPSLLPPDATVSVVADLRAPAGVPQVCIGIVRSDLTPVYGVASDMDGARPVDLGGSRYRYRLEFPRLPLAAGDYRVRAHALDETGTRLYDTVELSFSVAGDRDGGGLIRMPLDPRVCEPAALPPEEGSLGKEPRAQDPDGPP